MNGLKKDWKAIYRHRRKTICKTIDFDELRLDDGENGTQKERNQDQTTLVAVRFLLI